MATPQRGLDPRAIIEGRQPGRRRVGLIVAIAVALVCALLVLGGDLLQSVGSSPHSAAPFVIAVLLALLPVPLLVSIVLLLDRLEPEPRTNLVFAFMWGAGIAALLAVFINTAGLIFITQPDLGRTAGEYVSATFGAPVVEESLKGSALLWLLWRRRQEIDGPTDGIVYAAMVGLGFAMMENIGYYIDALVRPHAGGTALLGVTFVFRGLLAPFAHPVFTSMTGIGAAYAATHRRGGWAVAVGLVAAMLLHGLWNGLSVFGLPGIAVGYLILLCVLAGLAVVIVADRRRIVRLIWRFLPGYGPSGVVTDADLRMLSTLRQRRAARNWARAAGGPGAAAAMRDYQLAATELALLHLRAERRLISGQQFAARQQALLRLMAVARDAFFHHQPEPPIPPWAQTGQSGFGRHRPAPGLG
ncbi:MAG: PrsW family intramembrane metalloprotease [Actinobacteria bacterium]|nr:PrsW family intramembrane metalloprotease [Actinomycetota bacterium]